MANIDRVLTRARARLQPYLADVAVIARTSESIQVWVDSKGQSRSVPGLPDFVRVPVFTMTFEDRKDVEQNDVAVVTSHVDSSVLSYHILTVYSPTTFSVSTDADAIKLSVGASGSLPITPNDTVTFKNVRTGISVACDAWTYRLDQDPKGREADAAFRWASIFDPSVLDVASHRPAAGDVIYSSRALGLDANGNPRSSAILAKPLRTFGIMPLATVQFMESS